MSEDLAALAKLRLEEILDLFGIEAKVAADWADDQIDLKVDTENTSQLIGHRGETLQALQHILNAMVKQGTTERVYVGVDVGGYKQSRIDALSAKAREEAQSVIDSGSEKQMRPMNPAERRIVHMALSTIPEIITESAGDEPHRRVVIKKRPD